MNGWASLEVPEKQGVEPKPLSEPPARGVENEPQPTPLSGRGYKVLLLYVKVCRFSLKQQLDARASFQIFELTSHGGVSSIQYKMNCWP